MAGRPSCRVPSTRAAAKTSVAAKGAIDAVAPPDAAAATAVGGSARTVVLAALAAGAGAERRLGASSRCEESLPISRPCPDASGVADEPAFVAVAGATRGAGTRGNVDITDTSARSWSVARASDAVVAISVSGCAAASDSNCAIRRPSAGMTACVCACSPGAGAGHPLTMISTWRSRSSMSAAVLCAAAFAGAVLASAALVGASGPAEADPAEAERVAAGPSTAAGSLRALTSPGAGPATDTGEDLPACASAAVGRCCGRWPGVRRALCKRRSGGVRSARRLCGRTRRSAAVRDRDTAGFGRADSTRLWALACFAGRLCAAACFTCRGRAAFAVCRLRAGGKAGRERRKENCNNDYARSACILCACVTA